MRAYLGTLGALGISTSLVIAACSGNLAQGGTGTGGTAATTGTGGSIISGTGTGGAGGLVTPGSGGASGAGATGGTGGIGGTTGRSTVPDVHRASSGACSPEPAEAGVQTSVYDGGNGRAADGGWITCEADSDCPPCAGGQIDRCLFTFQGLEPGGCTCDQCNTDQDCPGTETCSCAATLST
ncbi:MAG TPA: hypothetical protein VGP64_05260, partial [Polyangia bacterium]